MENQEILKAIASLADKVSRYHERLLATERDNKRLEETLSTHLKGCSCHDKPKEIAKGPDYPSAGRALTEDERLFVHENMAKHKVAVNGS
jgi:hypothetical protein|tara:strand:- start:357 stop:626 length:270 start_codon:yes stop_codon:yes gene_type:complete